MSGRNVHLWRVTERGELVQDIASDSPLTSLACVQDEVLNLIIHNLSVNRSVPALFPFREQPIDFTTARASIVKAADAPPETGTFKLQVGDQITAAISWPQADAATFKADVLAKLKALANVTSGGVVAADPPGAPAHFLYFRWTDITRTDAISVVENRLTPPCDGEQEGSLALAGYTQLVKLSQLPYASTTSFARPSPPDITITETQLGAAGVDEEQTIIVPPTASGSVAFIWSGAQTKSLQVGTLTAAAIQTALNAIVANGDSNPSFAVEQRAAQQGLRFAVTFTGPLAASPQASLAVAMLDQLAWPYTVGTLDLRANLGIETALDGAASATLLFELVLDDTERYLLPITIANSATSPGVGDAIAAAGGVVLTTTTVYVDSGLGEPFASVAPGLNFTPPSSGYSFTLAHNFGSFLVGVRVFHRTLADPETWRELADTEFREVNIDANHVTVYFSDVIPTEELSDWRILCVSPDISINYFAHQHTWDEVRTSLPSGQTLRAKLAALDAALGMFGGTLFVNVTNLTGILKSTQIDLTDLAQTLVSNTTFATSLTQLFSSNTDVVNALALALTNNTTFTQTLLTQIANSTIIQKIAQLLAADADFGAVIRSIIYSLLQTGTLPGGATFHTLPDFSAVIPPFQDITGPTILTTRPQTSTVKTTAGDGTTTETTSTTLVTTADPTTVRLYLPLSPAITAPTLSGNKTGLLPDTATAGNIYTVVTSAYSREAAAGRPRGEVFVDGDLITFAAGHWYKVVLIGSDYYASECEQILVRDSVGTHELSGDNGARYSLSLPLSIGLEGNVEGRGTFVLETGVRGGGGTTDVTSVTWTSLFAEEIALSPATLATTFTVWIQRASGGTLTGSYSRFGKTTTFTPSSAVFDIRLRFTKFDVSDISDPRGALLLNVTKPLANIIQLAA